MGRSAQEIYKEIADRLESRYALPTDAVTSLGRLVCEHPGSAMLVFDPLHEDGRDFLRVKCGNCHKVAGGWVSANSPALPGEHVHRMVVAEPLPNSQVHLVLWEGPLGRTHAQIASLIATWEKTSAMDGV